MSELDETTRDETPEVIETQEQGPAGLDSVETKDEQKAKTNRTIWIILAVAALALIACCVGTLIVSSFSYNIIGDKTWESVEMGIDEFTDSTTNELTETFEVAGSKAEVIVENEVGETTIQQGPDGQVHVFAVVEGWNLGSADLMDEVDVSMEQRDDATIYVSADILSDWNNGRSPNVDLVISVPENTNVRLATDVGSTKVSGITGTAKVNSGVGDVEIDNFAGPLDVSVSVGEIDVRNWTPAGDSRLETNVGEISVRLDRAASLELDARTSIGDIDCEFDIDGERESGFGPNDYLRGTIGDDPDGELFLRADTGSISILKD